MASTYEPIATTTLGSASNSVTFSSITGTYTDLILLSDVKSFSTGGNILTLQFNSDTTSVYSGTYLIGNGSSASSFRNSSLSGLPIGGGNNGTGTTAATVITNIQNYSNTTTNKTVLSRFSNAGSQVDATVSLWASTAAINSVKIYVFGGGTTMASGSTFTIYGIKAA